MALCSCEVSSERENVNMIASSFRQATSLFSRRLRFLLVIALLGIGASFSGCTAADSKQQKAQAAAARSESVSVAKVERQDVPVYLVGLGSVTAFYTANIKSRVDGQIMRVNFQEGQTVKQGDLLIVIDPRPYQVQLEQMQAQLFKDQASLRDARLNLERYTTLIPSGSIAQQQVDTQKSTVDQLDGQVRTDQAQIDNAKLQLVYCNITAPAASACGKWIREISFTQPIRLPC
jgi:multidrug efflux system membrane fusion protein